MLCDEICLSCLPHPWCHIFMLEIHLHCDVHLFSTVFLPVSDLAVQLPWERLWKIRPSDISCSQDSIKNEFSDGHSLDETLAKLRSGQCRVEDIEKIQITWHSHRKTSPGHARWWTYTGNRRLSLFQKLEKEGCLPFIVAQWVNTPVPWWRMTTHQAGDQPRVRGSRGSK